MTRELYVRLVRPHIKNRLHQQRLKLLFFAWGYYPVLFLKAPILDRIRLLKRFLLVDWNVLHAHRPAEIAAIARAISEREGDGEVMIEAGCFYGGSTAKFSILCRMFGYRLHVYDSFQGVEPMSDEAKKGTYDFSGKYAASEQSVRDNVAKYGEISVCSFYGGWFIDTIANGVSHPVRVVYIDCDLAKGTREVLQGVLPSLTPDAWVFSQDFHIPPVRAVLQSPGTWPSDFVIRYHNHHLASVRLTAQT